MTHSTCDRWRSNTPSGVSYSPVKTLGMLAFSVFIMAVVATLLVVVLSSTTDAAESDDRPVLVLFTSPGCAPCEILKRELETEAGLLRKFPNLYRFKTVSLADNSPDAAAYRKAFLETIPKQAILIDLNGSGVRKKRSGNRIPATPILWIEGRSDYWLGYHRNTLNDLAYYLEWSKPISPESSGQPEKIAPVAPESVGTYEPAPVPQKYERIEPIPDPMFTTPVVPDLPEPEIAETNIAPTDPDFSGVTIVVMVAALGDEHQEIRSELARRANSALQGLVRKHIGERVDAYLIAEVAEPETFERLVATVGVRPGVGTSKKVAALVLIPERLDGFKGWITGKLETALADHYLPDLKKAGIMPIIERIHGDTFDAVLASLNDAGGGTPPSNQPFVYLVATYLSERSKFGHWIGRRLGWVA